jgi:hypothetical protein
MNEGLLREDLAADAERYYKACDGFSAMVQHPRLSAATIEALQRSCFREDFQRLGPSIYRTLETSLEGYRALRASSNPMLRRKAERIAHDLRRAYPVFLAGRLFGPNSAVRRRIRGLEREIHAHLGRPSWREHLQSLATVGLAMWTALTLELQILQHPRLVKHAYRLPAESPRPSRSWRKLSRLPLPVSVELRPERTIWVRLQGDLEAEDAGPLADRLRAALKTTRDRLVLDLEQLTHLEGDAAVRMAKTLREYRSRIRIRLPVSMSYSGMAAALTTFSVYHGPTFGA